MLISFSVEDKQKVSMLTHIPKFLPEITIGAHDYDEKYYAYKAVSCHVFVLLLEVDVWGSDFRNKKN